MHGANCVVLHRLGVTPNQISVLSLLFGLVRHRFCRPPLRLGASSSLSQPSLTLWTQRHGGTIPGAGSARSLTGSPISSVDAAVILGVGFSGIPIVSHIFDVPAVADFGVVGLALAGSLLNTFIKPVTYAEIGYSERIAGKIEDPLEGVGFFGRPETILVLLIGGLTGFLWVAVILIAVCTNLSALQRIVYLYRRYS